MVSRLVMISVGVVMVAATGCRTASGPEYVVVEESYFHERAAWSPDGLKIAFTVRVLDSAGVYVVDSTGANLRLLLPGQGIGVTWSPDAKWLAFSISGSLYKILANGDSLTQLTTNAADYRPAWSPDGKYIAYVNGGIMALDLQSMTTLNVNPYGEYPSWHKNSTDILFIVFAITGNNRYYNEFRTISLADSQETYRFAFSSNGLAAFSSFSNDGNQILMSVKPPDFSGLSQIVKGVVTELSLIPLTDDGGDYPSWSPDGSKIVYTRTAKGDGGLWIMNADGSGKHRLTSP